MSGDSSRNAGSRGSGGGAPGPAAAPVIAVRMEALLAWVAEGVAKFPRDHRFTVGDRLLHTCLDITESLIEASYRRDKRADLAAASRGLVRARVLMRLAHALRCVSEAQHLHFARESDEIGKMLGGWIRSAHPR
ncbi:diversity-generating retroelement protein Avd [Sorangium sp. So ce1024]|uniref:diversity-generating retroelement protein Avd n=1 Tax=unclassified Sorangium TaxID=2621164 RepID=UPI003F068E90